uniref:ABC-type transport system involved in Fe-S cluster assembly, permease component n=1 Tax=uncultured gamma proteobacterium HF0770_28K04 TaxID=723578 RepID=E7C7I1_9GAMM|nr:ABC-type transport system involved in Fe-S cluster assembly, permease component [uncultured gamma proteobacterium HF0770_28K04]
MSQISLSSIDSSLIEEISSKRNEPNWLREYRKNSLSVYHDLPAEVSPLYNKYTDARKMNPEQVSLSTSSDSSVPDFLAKRLDEIKNEIGIVQIGSNIHSININDELKSNGLVISSLDDALQNHSKLIQKALEDSDSKEDKYTALNNAAFNSGVFVYVPQNLTLDKPIHLVSCLSLDGISTISRNIIIAEKNTQASIVQELYAPKMSKQQAYLELLNTRIGENSKLDFTTFQIMDQSAVNFSTRRTHLAQDAKINWYLGLFGSMLSRYRIEYHLNGTGSAVNDAEVIFGNNDQSFDLNIIVNHNAQSTEGKIVEKSILKDTSKSLFKGMVRINEQAAHSNSFLSGRSILLSKGAKSDSIPGLEIFTNDVKATHSASVAQVDDEQIFYLGTRCLSHSEAERIIVEGFLEPLSRIMSYQVRAWLANIIESKWMNTELTINMDDQLKSIVEVEETRYNENDEVEQHYKYR